jgi:hypothetical protein
MFDGEALLSQYLFWMILIWCLSFEIDGVLISGNFWSYILLMRCWRWSKLRYTSCAFGLRGSESLPRELTELDF